MRTRDDNKEQAIRKKAIEMIVKKGLDGLSMQKLAKAANVSPATIYIYFKDREDLLFQLCLQENARMVEATLKGFDPGMSFSQGLKNQWKNRAAYWLEHPLEARFLEAMRNSGYSRKFYGHLKKEISEKMQQFVRGAIERKELVKLPLEVYWSVAFAPLYQLVRFHLSGTSLHPDKPFELNEKLLNQTLNIVLKALKP